MCGPCSSIGSSGRTVEGESRSAVGPGRGDGKRRGGRDGGEIPGIGQLSQGGSEHSNGAAPLAVHGGDVDDRRGVLSRGAGGPVAAEAVGLDGGGDGIYALAVRGSLLLRDSEDRPIFGVEHVGDDV